MPPKTRITKEMILDAAFEIVRESGIENVNARTVSKKLSCSTQPVMYVFATIEDLKKELYKKTDNYHSEYLMNIRNAEEIALQIGLNYINFAINEPNLFRFLFQSGYSTANNLLEMVDSEEMIPIMSAMQQATGMNMDQTKKVFISIGIFTHGYASLIANNPLEYDEQTVISRLYLAYHGAILATEEDK